MPTTSMVQLDELFSDVELDAGITAGPWTVSIGKNLTDFKGRRINITEEQAVRINGCHGAGSLTIEYNGGIIEIRAICSQIWPSID